MSQPPRVYFIRHGETEWSLSGRHTGRTDIPLTAHGEEEARRLAPGLQRIHFVHVYVSSRQRARATCQLAGLKRNAITRPELNEWDYGDYEGRRTIDIRAERPDWNVFRDGCPQGETPTQVSDRADKLIAGLRILRGDIALVSHGQFGSALAARWIGLPVIEAQHFPLASASLSILSYDPRHPETPVLALWNSR